MKLTRMTQALSDAGDVATRWAAVPIAAGYIILTFAGVIARFVLKTPIMEAVLYSRLGFVWTCLLGAALAYKRMKHIRFTVVSSLLPGRLKTMWDLGIDLLSLGFMCWTMVYAVDITRRVWPSKISGTDLSNGFMYIALPTALAVMILHCLNRIAFDISGLTDAAAAGSEP